VTRPKAPGRGGPYIAVAATVGAPRIRAPNTWVPPRWRPGAEHVGQSRPALFPTSSPAAPARLESQAPPRRQPRSHRARRRHPSHPTTGPTRALHPTTTDRMRRDGQNGLLVSDRDGSYAAIPTALRPALEAAAASADIAAVQLAVRRHHVERDVATR
jgi:hypothetical protein